MDYMLSNYVDLYTKGSSTTPGHPAQCPAWNLILEVPLIDKTEESEATVLMLPIRKLHNATVYQLTFTEVHSFCSTTPFPWNSSQTRSYRRHSQIFGIMSNKGNTSTINPGSFNRSVQPGFPTPSSFSMRCNEAFRPWGHIVGIKDASFGNTRRPLG